MKRVLFLICVLSLVANTVLAQERPEMRRENRRNTGGLSASITF